MGVEKESLTKPITKLKTKNVSQRSTENNTIKIKNNMQTSKLDLTRLWIYQIIERLN